MSLPAGTSLGRYQIRSPLGAGAMGEVYLADDVQLHRPVAIKMLLGELTRSREHLRRFEQEARAISALNHPNILTIHEVGRVESNYFIVTEFVDGVTLRHLIRHRRIKPGEATDITAQVASGLITAHKAGIIHRDIKPENIMVRRDGYVKVLDFGLAKLTEGLTAARGWRADESTVSNVNSAPGTAVGTVSYMSPEQLRGHTVDARADIWSLGVVLYEMVAGRAPFVGLSSAEVIVAVLEREPPPLERHAPDCPPELRRVVARALQKSRELRYQTVGEMLDDLRQLRWEAASAGSPGDGRRWGPSGAHAGNGSDVMAGDIAGHAGVGPSGEKTLIAGAGVRRGRAALWPAVAGLAGLALVWALSGSPWWGALAGLAAAAAAALVPGYARPARLRLTRRAPFQTFKLARLTETGRATNAVVSPDGRYVAYASESAGLQGLWVRQVATASNIQIVPPADVTYQGLTFSPDGDYVHYVFFENTRKNLWLAYQVPALGGVPKRLLAEAHTPVTFAPDGSRIAFVRGYPSEKVTALVSAAAGGGGERSIASRAMPVEYGWRGGPAWSPDGRVIVTAVGIYDVDMDLVEVDVRDGTERPLTSQRWPWIGRTAWLSDGSGLVFTARDPASGFSQIWYVSYPGGRVRRITNDLNDYHSRSVSVSADSRLLVSVQSTYLSSVWLVPEGDVARARPVGPGRSDGYYGLCWTPDGRLVYTSRASGSQDIWVMDGDGGNQKQLTFGAGSNYHPSVSPDGRYVVFISTRTGEPNIWRVEIGGDNPRQLTDGGNPSWPQCAPDGRWVVYKSQRAGKKVLWKIDIEGGEPVQVTEMFTSVPSVSPDGQMVACEYWDERLTSKTDVAVVPLDGGPPVRVFDVPTTFARSVHLSGVLRWAADGRQVTYVDNRGGVSNIWGQPLDGGPPSQLTDFGSDQIFWFDWSKDGRMLACARGIAIDDVVLISDLRGDHSRGQRSLH